MSKTKNNSKRVMFSRRKGIILIALLAMLILMVNIIMMSYSWFSPNVRKGTGMSYSADIQVRSESCTLVSHLGTSTNGLITYDNATYNTTYTVGANSIKYFKTIISNSSDYSSNVSLFISALPTSVDGGTVSSSSTFTSFGLGVAYPSNSYRTYTTLQEDLYIVRNAYIEGKSDGANGEISIEWFIKTGSSTVTVDLSKLYIMYN